jgi:hypothetical protein
VAEGVLDYQAANLRADAMDLKSEAKKAGAAASTLEDQLSEAIALLASIADGYARMFEALMGAVRADAATSMRRFVA